MVPTHDDVGRLVEYSAVGCAYFIPHKYLSIWFRACGVITRVGISSKQYSPNSTNNHPPYRPYHAQDEKNALLSIL